MANKNLKLLISIVIIIIFIISNISISFAVGEHNQSSTGTNGNQSSPDQGSGSSKGTSDNKSQSGQGTDESRTDGGGKKPTQPTTTPANDTGTDPEDIYIKTPDEVSLGDLGILVIFLIAAGLMAQKSLQEDYKLNTGTTRALNIKAEYYRIQSYINVLMPLLYALIPFIPDEAITLSDFDKYLA
jgi:uncharacterized membrane protein